MANDGTSVTITRRFDAPPQRVYQAFLDPDDLAAWMWGSIGVGTSADADPRPGGGYVVATDPAPGGESLWPGDRYAVGGVYALLEAPHRLVYTVHWDAPVGYNEGDDCVHDEVVVVDLAPSGAGTELTMLHMGIPDDGESADAHEEGIADMLATLASHLAE